MDLTNVPSDTVINRYIGMFFKCFAPHFPFLHATSFAATKSPLALVLAVASIGARYAFDHDTACLFHKLAINILGPCYQSSDFEGGMTYLWELQAHLLISMYVTWSEGGSEFTTSSRSLAFVAKVSISHQRSRWLTGSEATSAHSKRFSIAILETQSG